MCEKDQEIKRLFLALAERDALLQGLIEYADSLLDDCNRAWSRAGRCADDDIHEDADYMRAVKLLSASAEPSAPVIHPINMKTMTQAYEQVDHKAMLHGTSNWCAAMATALRGTLHSEPSATNLPNLEGWEVYTGGTSAPGTCTTCNGSRMVPDGEITGVGGVKFENGPVVCVKDCPDCTPSAPVERGPWLPLSAPGQIQEGDWLCFTVSGSFICAQARLIINPGTDKEEIVYNRKKNHYFCTDMAIAGTSNHKGVLVARAALERKP